ncbi:MAG: hypothetical protein LUE86_00015 [Clostridiales bacterium]|nr:hypothetical protein [Clostridiales bacterium]
MKKRFLGVTVLAAGLTLASAMTAFAGSWKTDSLGTYYENDDGTRPVYAGWFTDPDTGYVYFMNPDAYIMTDTEILGYRLASDGRRIDKTEEELAAEEEAKNALTAKSKTKSKPSDASAEAKAAGNAAKKADYAVTTTRLSYQSEMTTFMNTVYRAAGKATTTAGIVGDSQKDNIEVVYFFATPDGYRYFTAVLPLSSKVGSANYNPHAFELAYNYNSMGGDDATLYGDAFNSLILSSLGPVEGQTVIDTLAAIREAGTETFSHESVTDTGNYYELNYSNGYVTIDVTCSEITATEETEETGETTEAAETTEETTEAEATTSVIVAGQSQTTTEEETAAEEAASEETTTEETEATAEEAETTVEETAETEAVAEETEAVAETEAAAEETTAETETAAEETTETAAE